MLNEVSSEIVALAYIGIRSDQGQAWDRFARSMLGMQGVDKGGNLRSYRMDDRAQRLMIDGDAPHPGFFGWEVTDRDQLQRIAARLEAAGHRVQAGSDDLKAQRMVADLIWFHDPSGYRVEVCWQPVIVDAPFVPGRPITGFKTGPMGMGHVVLHADRFQETLGFYRDMLRFGVSDYFLSPYPVYFLHVNGRHHSLALAGAGKVGIHHFMVELMALDDVGQAYDIASQESGRLAYTLGRHTNDWMTSFYTHSPSGFFVEYGWGAREVDPRTWQSEEMFHGPSFWGHERLYLPAAEAKKLRDMRMEAAAKGLRAGDPVPRAWASSVRAKE